MISVQRPNIAAHFACANGFDQIYNNKGYPGIVYSSGVRWLMVDADLHWMVSDLLVTCGPFGPKCIKEDWHITASFDSKTGVMSYIGCDPSTGESVVVHTQEYPSHDCAEDVVFYIRDYVDGGRACKLVMMRAED